MKRNSKASTHCQPSAPKFCSAVLIGQAVLNLRRQARREISGFRSSRLLNLASALEATLPAIEALEPRL